MAPVVNRCARPWSGSVIEQPRGHLVRAWTFDVGTGIQQCVDELDVIIAHRPVQGGLLMSCPDDRSVDIRTVPDERADDLGRVRAMPWGVRVKMEKPPDVAVVVDEKDARYARVLFDQAVERGRIAALKSALKPDRKR
jgi:hypothetical protein